MAPTHPALYGHWEGQVEKDQSWPALSPCSIGPSWSHPAGWPESYSHYGLLGQEIEVITLSTGPAPFPTGMTNLITTGSYQRSHCCLLHEAGVLGSCGHLLRETGCQWPSTLSKAMHSQPPLPCPKSPVLSSPIPFSAQMPSLLLPQLLLAPPELT